MLFFLSTVISAAVISNSSAKEDELIEVLEQYLPQQSDLYKIAIGFVLDEEKYNFIND